MISVAASVKRLVHPSSQTGLGMPEPRGVAAVESPPECPAPAGRSIDGTLRFGALGRQQETGLRRHAGREQSRDVLADRRSVLEAVAGAAADDPDVVVIGVAIDQEIPRRG